MSQLKPLHKKEIENRIFTVRGVQVMIDNHLAELYGIETKILNRAVKRNSERFPEAFMFQLAENEWDSLRCQIGTSKNKPDSEPLQKDINDLRFQNDTSKRGGRRYHPFVFTEQGVAMLSAVLRSETAVKVSIQIMQAFVQMRQFIASNALLFQRIEALELKQEGTDEKVNKILRVIELGEAKPKQGIFYNGQIFDAYTFTADIIREAGKSIILIDNFVDDSVLTLLSKRHKNVNATIYTRDITKQLRLDLAKHNKQYPDIQIHTFKNAHDRFLIIDEKELYHFGASLKDLGKKWFAFSKMNSLLADVMHKLKQGGNNE
jgi:hypothetical protein